MKPRPASSHGRIELLSGTATSQGDTQVDTNATANTKGSWVSLVAATSHEYQCLGLTFSECETVDEYMVDIAVQEPGGSTQEIIVPDLIVPMSKGNIAGVGFYKFYVRVPQGAEIFMRAQRNTAGARFVVPTLYGFTQGFGGYRGGQEYIAIGALTATSRGTVLNPDGTTANAYPASFTQLTASLARDVEKVLVVVGPNGLNALGDNTMQIQIAVGAGNTVIADSLQFASDAGYDLMLPAVTEIDTFIASGQTVQARMRSSSTTQAADIALYGLVV